MKGFAAAQSRYDNMTPEDVFGEELPESYIDGFMERATAAFVADNYDIIRERATSLAYDNPPNRDPRYQED